MIKILFEGDSITDAKRDRSNCRLMGPGYPKYATELILENNKGTEFDFMNLSIGGNRSDNLIARIEPEVDEIQPDILPELPALFRSLAGGQRSMPSKPSHTGLPV